MKRRSSFSPLILVIAALCIGLLLREARHKPASVLPPQTAPASGTTPAVVIGGTAGFPRTVTDARGTTLTLKAAPMRIVSLIPSTTEIVYALGLGDRLAADTTACDYPPQARAKPHIDVFKGDREQIEIHNPDLVLAVDGVDPAALIAALEKDGLPVFVVKATDLQQTYDSIALIGKATGQEATANHIAADMRAQIESVQKTVAGAPEKPGVLVMFDDNPIYTVGPTGGSSFINDIINIAGGANIVMEAPANNIISPEKVVERQPDVIICSKRLVPRVKLLPGWNVVPAVANNRFFQTSDKTDLMRPGPRLPLAALELARFLHPGLFKTPTP